MASEVPRNGEEFVNGRVSSGFEYTCDKDRSTGIKESRQLKVSSAASIGGLSRRSCRESEFRIRADLVANWIGDSVQVQRTEENIEQFKAMNN